MQENVSKTDKRVRVVLAVMILVFGFYCQSWWGVAGLFLLNTGIIGICPFYALFGISTNHQVAKKL